MEQQHKLFYCLSTTIEHPVAKKHPKSVELFKDVIIREGGSKKNVFANEKCINLDSVETAMSQADKRSENSTMDCAFGLTDGKKKQIIMCEFRLNYKSVSNISKSEIDSKIKHSKLILGQEPSLLNQHLLIFKSELKNQAFSRIRRLYSNKNIVSVLDISELKNQYFQNS